MSFDLNDEQRLLQDQVRSLLNARSTPDLLRKLITDQTAFDADLWEEFSGLGLLGAAIPEAYGGVGLTPMELCIISEEIGRFVAPVPFFSSICLASEAILLFGTELQKSAWLPKLASGEAIGAFALDERLGPASPRSLTMEFHDGHLSGIKQPVAEAAIAAVLVVALADDRFALVETGQDGVKIESLAGFDQLRHHASVQFDKARAALLGDGPFEGGLDHLLNRAAVYQAFEQIGGAEAALTMARDYSLQRYIFGRQLASYQAVKHNLANILVQLELARSNALFAAATMTDNPGMLGQAAAAARLSASEAYETAARENLQTHGGIGFTWEADCHFHYRRARLLALTLGSRMVWSDRLIRSLETI